MYEVDIANTIGLALPPRCITTSPRPRRDILSNLRADRVKVRDEGSGQLAVMNVAGEELAQRRLRRQRELAPRSALSLRRAPESHRSESLRARGRAPRGTPSEGSQRLAQADYAASGARVRENYIANAFTKQVTADAAVRERGRIAPQSAKTIFTPVEASPALCSIVCSVSHSLTNPLNGGSAAIDSAPTERTMR